MDRLARCDRWSHDRPRNCMAWADALCTNAGRNLHVSPHLTRTLTAKTSHVDLYDHIRVLFNLGRRYFFDLDVERLLEHDSLHRSGD
jgi:hypothetical protein